MQSHQSVPISKLAAIASRFHPVFWLGLCFMAISMLTRLALLLATGSGVPFELTSYGYLFAVGFAYDLLAYACFSLPLVLLLWLLPARGLERRHWRAAIAALGFLLLFLALFVAVAEWTFWEEFETRFNFIAVDYLVYTTEVLGNIRESYPIGWIVLGLVAASLAIFFGTRRWRLPRVSHPTSLGQRSLFLAAWIGIVFLGTLSVSASMKDTRSNQYVNELAGNGIYQFFAAYRMASLDYQRFYRNLPLDQAYEVMRQALVSPGARFLSDDPTSIRRQISNPAPEKRLNVVLVSVESLSAAYSGTYGRTPSHTPRLDELAADSLVFTRLFASGTRTVRGLEALSLSVPPTPGESIVKRPGNEDLFSLARVFNARGYESKFLYGGYGAFDNMNYFFAHNGYQVRDRASIAPEDIHFANIWGVADEDLYSLALRELDATHARGKPFFAHVMTTSNHRPYSFPEGRGPWPQGTRESAVRYTDWALNDFIERARSKPWFADTLFILTADHCGSSAGQAQLPSFRYHIPMWIYAPAHIAPGKFERMVSQIDIAPTILGLLGIDYESEFYGRDVFQQPPGDERAFIGTYQLLGYLRPRELVQLSPGRHAQTVRPAFANDTPQPVIALNPDSERRAIAFYQTASHRFQHGLMRQAPVIDAVAGVR